MSKAPNLRAGSMMIFEDPQLPKLLDARVKAYLRGWRSVETLDSYGLRHMLEVAGLHLFFVVGQVKSVAFGFGKKALQKAVNRVAAKVRRLGLNCLELTEITKKRFLGVPYFALTAHTYHIQQGSQLQTATTLCTPTTLAAR